MSKIWEKTLTSVLKIWNNLLVIVFKIREKILLSIEKILPENFSLDWIKTASTKFSLIEHNHSPYGWIFRFLVVLIVLYIYSYVLILEDGFFPWKGTDAQLLEMHHRRIHVVSIFMALIFFFNCLHFLINRKIILKINNILYVDIKSVEDIKALHTLRSCYSFRLLINVIIMLSVIYGHIDYIIDDGDIYFDKYAIAIANAVVKFFKVWTEYSMPILRFIIRFGR